MKTKEQRVFGNLPQGGRIFSGIQLLAKILRPIPWTYALVTFCANKISQGAYKLTRNASGYPKNIDSPSNLNTIQL